MVSRIRERRDGFVIQVQEAADPRTAAEGLGRARADIFDLDGGQASMPDIGPQDRNNPKYVSEVMPAATGPFVVIDAGYTPWRLVRTIPEVVAARLVEAGVTEAVLASPKGGPLSDYGAFPRSPRAVVLRLYPPPPPVQRYQRARGKIPDAWLEEVDVWLAPAVAGEGQVWGSVHAVDFPLPAGQVRGFFEQCRSTLCST